MSHCIQQFTLAAETALSEKDKTVSVADNGTLYEGKIRGELNCSALPAAKNVFLLFPCGEWRVM